MSDIQNEQLEETRGEERRIRDAVCIDTARVYDSCADRDCLANLRVYFTEEDQPTVNTATAVRCRGCEVLNVFSEIERVPFNNGYYAVDNTFFFEVSLDVYTAPSTPPQTVRGLCSSSKKSILYGSAGSVKIFSSEYVGGVDSQLPAVTTNPRAKVQVATPICLDAKLCAPGDDVGVPDVNAAVPEVVRSAFQGQFRQTEDGDAAVRVTLGLFTIVQLERDVQMLIPAYDFCMPTRECAADAEDPCDAFRRISFPVSEFFPPEANAADANAGAGGPGCGCAG